MTRRSSWFLGAAVLVLMSPAVWAEDSCLKPCRKEVKCEAEVTGCLIESDRIREAIDRLKPLVSQHPERPAFARLLASAYLADKNAFWAQRVLQQSLDRNPKDCESRSWLAWVYIGEGDLELAGEVMKEPGCPAKEADRARWNALNLYISHAAADTGESEEALRALGKAEAAYPEDQRLWRHYLRAADPGWIEPLSLRAEVSGGYTSNSRAGSPSDPSTKGTDSGLGRFDLYSRLVLPASGLWRASVEGNVKGHGLWEESSRELSYLDLSIRPGVIIGAAFPRVLLAYKGNLLLIALDDKTSYYEAHRGEAELETSFGLLAFAGAGRRIFRENGRTRTELDGGLGLSISPHARVQLLFALTGRYYWAVAAPYDQVGGTALLAGRVGFGPGFYARLGVTPGLDYYPRSGGQRGAVAFGTDEERFDFLIKQFEELWSPSLTGVRFGVRYEFSWRDSTADRGEANYDYSEHRVLAAVRWTFDVNPWGPKIVSSEEHVELDYGLAAQNGAARDEERIQDLLRQDEAARAGSSCVD